MIHIQFQKSLIQCRVFKGPIFPSIKAKYVKIFMVINLNFLSTDTDFFGLNMITYLGNAWIICNQILVYFIEKCGL